MRRAPSPTPAIDRHALLCVEARRWVGVREIGGDNRGQLVELFQRATDGLAQREPWCAAFVRFCLDAVDAQARALGCADAALVYRSEHVGTVWAQTAPALRRTAPAPGLLVCWAHLGADGRPTGAGHMGIVIEALPAAVGAGIHTVEGNTGPGPLAAGPLAGAGQEREGDGVFRRLWPRPDGIPGTRLLGYLDPWG